MATQNWVIFTAAQAAHAQTLDDDGNVVIAPRAVDNANPGIGLNINPDAIDHAPGAAVTLVGTSVAPKRIIDDPEYQQYCPGLVAYLLTLPWAMLESETIFAPQLEN